MHSIQLFRAFISYCHADRAFAVALQRRLEAYRLPRRLSKQLRPLNGQPTGRLGPVFRDRADLSAAVDLSEAVRNAIAASSALIVIASPDAVGSQWVAREIELFRALHPDLPILVAHIRGEPADALPMALRSGNLEPLAADFRRDGDGQRLAFLKIVAGLADLPLDALVQRDTQRQLRRVTMVTLGVTVVALIMSALLVVARQAETEAERQRADAERLIEFMLTDLRKELVEDGRFHTMDTVNARALDYYVAQGDLQRLPDTSLERRARVLLAMGEDDEKRDQLSAALAKFNEAHRTTAATLARWPNNPEAIFAHAQSEYWVGRIWERRRDWKQALARYRAYDALARKLVAIDPNNPKYLMEAGFGQSNLGQIQSLQRVAPDYGRSQIARAIRWFEKAASKGPTSSDIVGEIANAHAWLADSYYLAGDFARSLDERRLELSQRQQIATLEPTNNAARFRFAKAQFGVAWHLAKLGRAAEVRPALTTARETMVKLVQLEPSNQQWRTILLRIQNLLKEGEDNDDRNGCNGTGKGARQRPCSHW